MFFAPLPVAFPKLQALVQSMDTVAITNPPPIESIGRRLRKIFSRARGSGYRNVAASAMRKLPYAYWLPRMRALVDVEGPLVQRYWGNDLPQALVAGPRRAKRWLTPLFFTYCESFSPADEVFRDYARRLLGNVNRGEGGFAQRLREMHRDIAFFDPDQVPGRLAAALMGDTRKLDEAFESLLLWPRFTDTPLGDAVFKAAIGLGPQRLAEWAVIVRLLDWERRLDARVVQTPHRIRFADALLKPWSGSAAPDRIKSTLIEFFTRVYGDPRMAGNRHYQWEGVSGAARSVLMGWLAGDTLRGFMRVLERTADPIWRFRQKFWMAYYNAGHIQEVWLALGSQAAWYARQLQSDERGLGYGTLDSGAAANQSVLLLKIGHLVFTEWSHNGSLRAYLEDGEDTPELYQGSYHGYDLRAAESLDFHDGANVYPQLAHMNSSGGTWQRKARDFIRDHTGVQMNDWEIM